MKTTMMNAAALALMAVLAAGDARAQGLSLAIDGGFQPNDTTWVVEAGRYFDLRVESKASGTIMLVYAPLFVENELREKDSKVGFLGKMEGSLRLENIILDKSLVGTAYTLQAFLVTEAGEVHVSPVINLFVTDYLAPEPTKDEKPDDQPKSDPGDPDQKDPTEDDRESR